MNEMWEFNAERSLPIPLQAHFQDCPENSGLVSNLSTRGLQIDGLVAKEGECKTIVIPRNEHFYRELRLRALCKWSTSGGFSTEACCAFVVMDESVHDFARIIKESVVPGSSKLREWSGKSTTQPRPGQNGIEPREMLFPDDLSSAPDIGARTKQIWKDAALIRRLGLYALLVIDLVGIVISMLVGYCVSPQFHGGMVYRFPAGTLMAVLAAFPVFCLIFGMYERECIASRERSLLNSALTACCLWASGLASAYFVSYSLPGRWIAVSGFFTLFTFLFSARICYRKLLERFPLRVLLLGTKEERDFIEGALRSGKTRDLDLFDLSDQNSMGIRVGRSEHVFRGLDQQLDEGFDWLVVSKGQYLQFDHFIVSCLIRGIRVDEFSSFVEKNFHRTAVASVDIQWLVLGDKSLLWNLNRITKRSLECLLATTAVTATSPLWLLIAILIKVDDHGPVFFRQTRVGRQEKHFKIWKFRTMCLDAEKFCGPQWAKSKDPRVTRVGRVLRRTRLDELPQFLNVIRGDMSLIGPRPERPEFVATLRKHIPHYNLRHLVRPGISGWAQVKYRYGASIEDARHKLSYDLYYIKYGSFFFDLYLMLRTLGIFVRGAR